MVVIAPSHLQEELLAQGLQNGCEVIWLEEPEPVAGTSAYIDLGFEPPDARISALQALLPALLLVNAVAVDAGELPEGFIRINGWPGFLKRKIMEVAVQDTFMQEKVKDLLSCFGKVPEWVADQPGFIAPRVVSMIINEAYLACGESVSTREEIDTAMQLGTGYPAGPFAWARLIGPRKVAELLHTLARVHPGYQPAALLLKDAGIP